MREWIRGLKERKETRLLAGATGKVARLSRDPHEDREEVRREKEDGGEEHSQGEGERRRRGGVGGEAPRCYGHLEGGSAWGRGL